MSHELTEMSVLVSIIAKSLIAKGVLSKEDLLAELSSIQQLIPQSSIPRLQELILNLQNQ